jgi:hypothetical protein
MAVKGEFGLALGRHYRGRERNPEWAKSPAPMDATAAGWTDRARCTFGRAVLRLVTQARVGRSGVGRDDSDCHQTFGIARSPVCSVPAAI